MSYKLTQFNRGRREYRILDSGYVEISPDPPPDSGFPRRGRNRLSGALGVLTGGRGPRSPLSRSTVYGPRVPRSPSESAVHCPLSRAVNIRLSSGSRVQSPEYQYIVTRSLKWVRWLSTVYTLVCSVGDNRDSLLCRIILNYSLSALYL